MLAMLRNAWAQVLSALLGVWLMASPAVLNYAGTAGDTHRIVGPVAASFAFVAIWAHMRPLRWVNLALGFLLIAVPWVVTFPPLATANGVVVGLLLIGLAFVCGMVEGKFGGGWSSLWTGNVAEESPNSDPDSDADTDVGSRSGSSSGSGDVKP